MSALICGSVAYDVIMVFKDHFKNHILPDKIHMLNVAFLVPELRREFGGCAGNIAYTLKLLGCDAHPLGAVGSDFSSYARWMDEKGISRQFIRQLSDTLTAQAYITTDLDDNQITAFHPGAMSLNHQVSVPADAGITLGMVSPENKEGILTHSRQFHEAGIPFIFDPGQAMPLLDEDDLKTLIGQADWLAANDYECQLIQQRTGWSVEKIAEQVKAFVVTRGGEGSLIHADGQCLEIPTAKPHGVIDPTGCGDAYRAGLIHGMMEGLDWPTIGRMASLAGAVKVENHGTQNHRFTPDEFKERFAENFGYRI